MPGIDRFGVTITEECHAFKMATPAQLAAACARTHPDRIPRPLLDAMAEEAERFGPGGRRGRMVIMALLMLAGLSTKEVAAVAGLAYRSARNMASLGRQALARRGQREEGVEGQARRFGQARRAEAIATARAARPHRRPHRRTSPLLPSVGGSTDA